MDLKVGVNLGAREETSSAVLKRALNWNVLRLQWREGCQMFTQWSVVVDFNRMWFYLHGRFLPKLRDLGATRLVVRNHWCERQNCLSPSCYPGAMPPQCLTHCHARPTVIPSMYGHVRSSHAGVRASTQRHKDTLEGWNADENENERKKVQKEVRSKEAARTG